jgi:hypothetical protein
MTNNTRPAISEGIVGAIKNVASNAIKKTVSSVKKDVANYSTAGMYSNVKAAVNTLKKADKPNKQKKPTSSGSLQQRAGRNKVIKAVHAEQTIIERSHHHQHGPAKQANKPTDYTKSLNQVKTSTKAAYIKSLRHPVMKSHKTHIKMKGPKSPFNHGVSNIKPIFSENEINNLETILKNLGE